MARKIFSKKRNEQDQPSAAPISNGFLFPKPSLDQRVDAANDHGYDPLDPTIDDRKIHADLEKNQPDYRDDPYCDGMGDPHLLDARSSDLNSHIEQLGLNATQLMQTPQFTQDQGPDERGGERKKFWETTVFRRSVRAAISAVIVLGVVAALFFLIFQVTDIQVQGNLTISRNDVIALSGIHLGDNIFLLDENVIKKYVARNPYLIFVCLDKSLPGRVTIQVQERTATAYISYCGILYTMDSRGMVLSSTDDAMNLPSLLRLEGLSIRSCGVGRKISLLNETQLSIYMEVMRELKALDLSDVVTELYVTDVDNIYLTTKEGYSVRMGTSERIHAKLRSLELTRERLLSMGKGAGTIDVSTPESPTYIPEKTGV